MIDPETEGYVRVEGGRLWAEWAGEGSGVVLAHAGIADARQWDPQWDALVARHRVVRYDLRGFGRADVEHVPFSNRDDLIAVMDKSGKIFNQPFFQTMEKITLDAAKIEHADASRVSSIFTPNVRFVEVVEDGFAGGNVIPATFTPNVDGFTATDEQFTTIKANIEKAGIVGQTETLSGSKIAKDAGVKCHAVLGVKKP